MTVVSLLSYEAEINQQLTGHGSVADTEGW